MRAKHTTILLMAGASGIVVAGCTAALAAQGAAGTPATVAGATAASPAPEPSAPSTAARNAAAVARAEATWNAAARRNADTRLAWWRDARFGAFIHWGPYSVLGGVWKSGRNPGYAEHIMRVERIPFATYRDEVAARFHPDAFDATAWVRALKAAGMKYIIITAKHHDGFALWPSAADPYNIAQTSHYPRDPLKELSDAAHAAGLRFGFYYSHAWDWADRDAPGNDWDYQNPAGDKKLLGGGRWYDLHPEATAKTQAYIDRKAIPQIRELIARYHPDILWFDTPQHLPLYQQLQVVEAVRKADPNIVVNGRAARADSADGLGNDGSSALGIAANYGDYRNTADRPLELRATPGDWESLPTTNESYAWNKVDHAYKPPSYFIRLLANAASKGGNVLLNVGPRGDGTLDPPDVSILQAIGAWTKVNGESIYGTSRTPLDRQAWGDSTAKRGTLYLHVYDWPKGGRLTVAGIGTPVRSAYLLADPARRPLLTRYAANGDLSITVPATAPDAVDSVVVIQPAGRVRGVRGRLLEPRDFTNRLLAFDANEAGPPMTYADGRPWRYYASGFEQPGAGLVWPVRVAAPARFAVSLMYTTDQPGHATARAHVTLNGQDLAATLPPTPSEKELKTVALGTVSVAPGPLRGMKLTVDGAPAGVRVFEVRLEPVR